MNIILTLLGVIAALFGVALFQKSKADTANALNQNIKTKEDLLKTDEKIVDNNVSLKQEDIKRNQLAEDVKKDQNEEVSSRDVLDFFNNRK